MREVELKVGQLLRCGLCKTVLQRGRRSQSFQPACAIAICGLLFLALSNVYPIMDFSVAGNTQENEIITGVVVLVLQGYWPIAVLVFFCAVLAPFLYFSGVTYVSAACLTRHGLIGDQFLLRVVRLVQPWSLVPVFAGACLVSAVKLDLIGSVTWRHGIGWIALLAVCTLALGSLFDAHLAAKTLQSKRAKP